MEMNNKKLNEINTNDIGKIYLISCRIKSIYQTSGPTIFVLEDQTNEIKSVAFSQEKGKNPYPNLHEGDFISAKIKISQRDNQIESQLLSYGALDKEKSQELIKQFDAKESNELKPEIESFLVNTPTYEALKDKIISAVKLIKSSIIEGRPIFIRHHADCDGYSAAICLENSISTLIIEKQGSDRLLWQYLKKSPSRTPFYDYVDATRDSAYFLSERSRHNLKMPLIILCDLGASEENILSLKKVKALGANVIVIDHHNSDSIKDGKSVIDNFVDVHINPHLVGGNSKICAGMLCFEISRFIKNNVDNLMHLPAFAGTADRCEGDHMNEYLKIAYEHGFDYEYLKKMTRCFDYEVYHLGYSDSKELIEILIGKDKEKQSYFVNFVNEHIDAKWEKHVKVSQKFVQIEEMDNKIIAYIDLNKTTIRGDYFGASKTTKIAFEFVKTKFKDKRIVMIGHSSEFITFRSDQGFKSEDNQDFDLNNIIRFLRNEKPHALVEGGGHNVAGTMRFLAGAKEEIFDYVIEYLKKLR